MSIRSPRPHTKVPFTWEGRGTSARGDAAKRPSFTVRQQNLQQKHQAMQSYTKTSGIARESSALAAMLHESVRLSIPCMEGGQARAGTSRAPHKSLSMRSCIAPHD